MLKQFTTQKEAMRMQHQHEQLTFLQARYSKEYQESCGPNELQWPVGSDLFRGVPLHATRFVIDCFQS